MEKFVLGNTGADPLIRTENDRIPARFGHLNEIVNAVTALQETPPGSGIVSVQAGYNITVDDSDPLNPIVGIDKDNLNFASGTFTPSVSDQINFYSITPYEGTWLRVGESVTFGFYFEFELENGFTGGVFRINLPEMVNNFTSTKSNSWLCSGFLKELGTENIVANQITDTQTVSIVINGYGDGAANKVNFISIFTQ